MIVELAYTFFAGCVIGCMIRAMWAGSRPPKTVTKVRREYLIGGLEPVDLYKTSGYNVILERDGTVYPEYFVSLKAARQKYPNTGVEAVPAYKIGGKYIFARSIEEASVIMDKENS